MGEMAVTGARCGPLESAFCPRHCIFCQGTIRVGQTAYIMRPYRVRKNSRESLAGPTAAHEKCLADVLALIRHPASASMRHSLGGN